MDNNAQGGKGGKSRFWTVVILIAAALALAFWWYSLRPMLIRKDCYKNENWTSDYYKCLMRQGVDFRLQ
jgi:hypothetical protein